MQCTLSRLWKCGNQLNIGVADALQISVPCRGHALETLSFQLRLKEHSSNASTVHVFVNRCVSKRAEVKTESVNSLPRKNDKMQILSKWLGLEGHTSYLGGKISLSNLSSKPKCVECGPDI